MARIFIDGGEGGTPYLWDHTQPTIASGGYVYSGNYGLSCPASKYIPETDEIYLSCKTKFPVGNVGMYVLYNVNGDALLTVYYSYSTGKISFYAGTTSGTLLGTTTSSWTAGVWRLMEIRWKAPSTTDGNDGLVQMKMDGIATLAFDFTGDNCLYTDTHVGRVYIGAAIFDDVVFDDAEWVGDTRIGPLVPNAPGNSSDWIASNPNTDGDNNWSMVDEDSVSTTDYVQTDSVDQVDMYSCANPTAVIHEIKCVQVGVQCLKGGAPTPKNVKSGCRTGSTNYFGDNKEISSVLPVAAIKLWSLNPNTGVAWTKSDLDGIEIGFESGA